MLTVGSLFSGIGGLELGFERAGFEVRWQVEIDPWCRKVLTKHWPTVPKYEDVRNVGADNLEWVDVIVGGFPCQPVSVAGERKGKHDDRWLWPEYARIIHELRPRYAIMENVPGILSAGVGDVFRDLAQCGYDAEWQVLPASAFGAPHRRERIFVIAYPNGIPTGRLPVRTPEEVAGTSHSRTHLAYPERNRLEEPRNNGIPRGPATAITDTGWWAAEPNVGRMAYGVPRRVDRLRGLGNAVVPQVAQYVAECVKAHAEADTFREV